jgi:peptide/nickel transport system permease protein
VVAFYKNDGWRRWDILRKSAFSMANSHARQLKRHSAKGMMNSRPLRLQIAWMAARAAVILLISGLAGATLIRIAPGFGIDEQVIDPRLSRRSLDALDREHWGERNPIAFYTRFLGGLLRGDAGQSIIFGQPVGSLIRDRLPTTVGTVTAGLCAGWIAAIVLAFICAAGSRRAALVPAMALSGSLLSIPSAVVATVCLLLNLPAAYAIAAVVFPRVFPHVYEQLRASLAKPHVLMARARGLSPARVFLFHAVPPVLMPMLALAGVSITLAFGASIPIEALSDSPGLGQLAWRAALGRDLPVLVSITLLLTAVTVVSNLVAELAMTRVGGPAA